MKPLNEQSDETPRFGLFEGEVTDVDDPLKLGRIRAKVPAVLGSVVETGWALPCAPFGGGADRGMLFLPSVGDSVWIEFAGGETSRPIWVGTFWGIPEGSAQSNGASAAGKSEVPGSEDRQAGPKHSMIKTSAGHRIVFDDEGGLVIFAHGSDQAQIEMNKQGEVTITAAKIKLGASAAESIILGDTFKDFFNAHTHPTGVGPSGPPVQPMLPTHLSQKNKTQ